MDAKSVADAADLLKLAASRLVWIKEGTPERNAIEKSIRERYKMLGDVLEGRLSCVTAAEPKT
jgi:hypothetical protein